jgi:triphosphatase
MGRRMSLAELARLSIRTQVTALCEQEAAVRQGEDPEAVHRMRVASRRLRAILRVFEDVLPAAAGELRVELTWLARALGEVRDLDVELAHLRDLASSVGATPEAFEAVVCAFDSRRSDAGERLQAGLDAPRYAVLLAALEDLADQPWDTTSTDQPAAIATPRLIQRRYRRLRKAGDALDAQAPAEALHRARIRAKQLRYTLEVASEMYGKPARALIRRTVRLQDLLGQFQDATLLEQRLRSASELDGHVPGASLFLLGQLTEACAAQARLARAEVPRTYARVTGRAWKRLKRRMASGV